MYKIIGGDGKEYGPVSAEQLRAWVREGRANGQTQVQPEGATGWQGLEAVPEFADLFGAVAAPPAVPAAAPVPTVAQPPTDYTLDLGGCLSRGWALFKANMGLLLGTCVVYGLILFALALIGMIPIVGILASIGQIVVTGPLLGGLYWIFIQTKRGLPAAVGDLFAGFSRAFGNLILVQLVSGILAFISAIPGLALTVGGFIMIVLSKEGKAALMGPGIALAVVGGLVLLAGLCVVVYLTTCWAFAMPLVVDRQMGFWDAMSLSRAQVRKQWWGVFVCLLVFGLVSMAGLLACGIGLLFTGPMAFAAIVYLYEDIFGGPAQAA
jgi:uncharacterized membrane protein